MISAFFKGNLLAVFLELGLNVPRVLQFTLAYYKQTQVDREFKVLSALHSVHFPVPHPLLYCNNVTVIGTDFYIMECVKVRQLCM